MKTIVEPLEGNKVKLSVEVDEQEFEKAVDAAYRRIAREVRIPGFRPGKAPRRLLQARIGTGVAREQALRDSLPDYYAEALRQSDVDPISPPEIDITSGHEEGNVAFDAVVEVRPQTSIAGYHGLRVVLPNPAPTDDEVSQGIDRLRDQAGELLEVSRPAKKGDYVSVDVKAERAGEPVPGLSVDDYLYEIGAATLVPELDEQLRGAKVGDILSFGADLDGGPVSFRVLVKDLKEKVLPEISDEWAAEASEFDTVEELREDIRRRLGVIKRVQVTMAFRDEALKALTELVEEDVPEVMVTEETERRWHELARRLQTQGTTIEEYSESSGVTLDDIVDRLRADAAQAVRSDLALRALADAEGIEAGDADVDAEIERAAHRLDQPLAEVRRQLEQQDAMATVRSDVRKAKALEWLLEHVEVVDEEGQPIDRAVLSPDPGPPPGAVEASAEGGEGGEEGENPQ